MVSRVGVKVGDQVKAGTVLASLEARDTAARLTQARGALAQAQANYQKVLSGASNEEVAVAQVAVDNAKNSLESTKQQQQVAVDNAYKALLNSSLTATSKTTNISTQNPTISGTYLGIDQGKYVVTITTSGSNPQFTFEGLEKGGGFVNSATVSALGAKGLFIQFPSTVNVGDSWTINIPNTQALTYVTNYNAYLAAGEAQKSAVAAGENAVAAAQAALDLRKAQARPADLAAAQAAILSAQGQVEAAGADLENSIIRAPSDGTITKVDVKVGELATALKESVVLQDVKNLHVEANISEANIASVKVGQQVDATFDALGLDRKFTAKVEQVDRLQLWFPAWSTIKLRYR